MSTTELRGSISDLLEQTDDTELMLSILILLKKSIPASSNETAVFEADGTPISEDELVATILSARDEMREGNKIPFEDLIYIFG